MGSPSPFYRRYEFALQRRRAILSASDTLLREPITKLAFPPGALLAGLTQWWQGSDGRQPIVYRFIIGPSITPLVLKKMKAASPDQRAYYDWAWSGNSQIPVCSQATTRYHTIYWIVSQSTIVRLVSLYTEQNVNQCILNGSVSLTFSCYTERNVNPCILNRSVSQERERERVLNNWNKLFVLHKTKCKPTHFEWKRFPDNFRAPQNETRERDIYQKK